MNPRPFGGTGLRVSELGLGCARIGGIFQTDPRSFVDLLATARDRGITFFDTADMYSQGESEKLIGRAFRRGRDRVVIASKVGYCLPAQRRLVSRLKPIARPLIRLLRLRRDQLPAAVRGTLAQDFSPAYIRRAVEASLGRLRTDYLDLLQLHSPPAEIVERGEWVEVVERLRTDGKIRFYGVACESMESARAALRFPGVRPSRSPSACSSVTRPRLVPRAQEQNVAVIARECLANGLLIKREADIDLRAYCHSPEQEELRRGQLSEYRRLAAERGVPLARLAVDYASSVPGVSVTLVGVRSVQQLTTLLRDVAR